MPVALRPITADELELLLATQGSAEGAGEHQWFGYSSGAKLRERVRADAAIGPDGGILAVVAEDAIAGSVEWFPAAWGQRETSACWSIAIGLLLSPSTLIERKHRDDRVADLQPLDALA